jgi:NAD(P)-dependent dehydrogenase (short-subunit alcohol dehydrogenase family)
MEFRERHVIVTGGTGALGTAVVALLLEAGATCHVPYVNEAEAQRFPQRDNPAVTLYRVGDLADEGAVTRLYGAVPQLWASLHLAGGFAAAAIAETGAAQFKAQIDGNLTSCFLCCRAAVMTMAAKGEGRIVNVAARAALEWRTGAGMTAYAVSKAGVAALTAALAQEVVGQGILVNAVAPSIMDTPGNRAAMPKAAHAAWPSVEDVAATILFLASPNNRVTRGAIVPVYGRV